MLIKVFPVFNDISLWVKKEIHKRHILNYHLTTFYRYFNEQYEHLIVIVIKE